MTLNPAAVAQRLLDEHRERRNFTPFAADSGITGIDGAYSVQAAFVAGMLQGRAPGYKIGLTSKRMQQMCRIDTPIAGVVLPGRVHESGAVLERSRYGRLGLEFEIAVRMGRDLPPSGAPFTREAVAAAVDAVAPAVEIVDDRQCDYKTLEVLSLVADNSWNEGLVHGAFVTQWPALETAEGVVELDGVAVDRGLGGDVLGHPFEPLTWLANHLAQTGGGLCAGDIVMTGSLVTTRFPPVPGRFRFAVSGLGAVEVAVA